MTTPEHIKKIIEDYKKPHETIKIMPEVINYQDQVYYAASYHKGREVVGYLILKENGSLPTKPKVVELLFIAISISNINATFFRLTRRLMKKKFIFVLWTYKILKRLEKKYCDETEGLKYIQSYRKTMESILINNRKFKENGLIQKKLLLDMRNDGSITRDLFYKTQELQLELGRCLFFINYDQMKSHLDRKKTIKFLLKKGDILAALKLFLMHIQLHPPYIKTKNQEDFEFTKIRYLDHKVPEQQIKEFSMCISILRNPTSPVSEDSSQLALDFYQSLGEPIEGVE